MDEYDVPLENAYYKGFYTEMMLTDYGIAEGILEDGYIGSVSYVTDQTELRKKSKVWNGERRKKAVI